MTQVYMGVSPASDDTAAIETGVYMRMGTHVADPTIVDEATHLPSIYTGGLAASEGIFITSVGSFIVDSADRAYIEYGGSLTQKIVDGDYDTTVDSGNVKLTMQQKGFKLKGSKKFLVESHHVNGITIEASDGKVSSKAKAVYNHTFGAYLKQVVGTQKKITQEDSTNVSLAWVYPLYLTAVATGKMATLSLKVADGNFKALKVSSGGLATSFGYVSIAVIPDDTGFAIMYIKARGVQLETKAMDLKKKGVKTTFGVALLHRCAAKAKMGGIRTHFGIKSKFPGV